jgi:NodT family efflux transporter outer membrane factor (OMF) lipoprotein
MSSKKIRIVPVLLSASLVLSGCLVGPDYTPPNPTLPEAYGSAPDGKVATTQSSAGTAAHSTADLTSWWKAFEDPQLDSLVTRAVRANRDLQVAEARLREARGLLGIEESAFYPTVDANGSASRSRQSQSIGDSGGFGASPESTLYRAGFDASWELDIFGRTRRAVEAGRADLQAAADSRNAVLTSLLAEVASNYILLRGAQQQIRIANDNIESQKQTLALNEARFAAGISSEFDVARARAQVAAFEATVPVFRITEASAIHRLGVLLGDAPASLKAELSPPETVPMVLPEVPVGLPSDLLRRRPDIRRAERELAAATARIGVATADLFPRFSLTGSFGTSSDKLPPMTDSRSIFWSVGPSVSWNVFDGNRIRSNIKVQNARQEQFLYTYEQTILTSLEEVENAVTSYTQNVIRREALRRAVEASRRSVELAVGRFAGGQGVGDLLDVLVAQRDLFNAEDALVRSETQLSADLVALYKALGGGWETFPQLNSPAAPYPATAPADQAVSKASSSLK